MPSTIPYDPSLVLANIVHPDRLSVVQQISALQAAPDAAQETLNSLISMRRSFGMTAMEVHNLGVQEGFFAGEITALNAQVADAAIAYAKARVDTEKAIQPLRAKVQMVHSDVESPVDYERSDFKQLPLSANSLNMDVQYFSYDKNSQSSATFASTVASYVAGAVSELGTDIAGQMSRSAASQVNRQLENHTVAGTLVFALTCTHQNARVIAPFILNVDKGIRAWNKLFPDNMIKTDDPANMNTIAQQDSTPQEKSFSIISGVTYGSSFVGMVHVLDVTDTRASEKISDIANSLQAQMDAGSWFEHASGGFGVNEDFGNDVKNLLSAQNVSSHVTLISMGIIPSIVANDMVIAAEQFSSFGGSQAIDQIANIQSMTQSDQTSVRAASDAARTGQQMIDLQGAAVKNALSAIASHQDATNSVIDINSMMTALQDFVKQASSGTAGVPINYYLKEITAAMLAEQWQAKYRPGKYLAIQNDDSGPASGGASAGGARAGRRLLARCNI